MYFKNLTTPFRDDCTEFISSVSYIFMIIYNYKLVSFFVQLSIFKAQDLGIVIFQEFYGVFPVSSFNNGLGFPANEISRNFAFFRENKAKFRENAKCKNFVKTMIPQYLKFYYVILTISLPLL